MSAIETMQDWLGEWDGRPTGEEALAEYHEFLLSDPYTLQARQFPEAGVYTAVRRLLFHYTLILGEIGDRTCCSDRWCYQTRYRAYKGWILWDAAQGGEPEGWHKHPATGRLRPGGDPALEYRE